MAAMAAEMWPDSMTSSMAWRLRVERDMQDHAAANNSAARVMNARAGPPDTVRVVVTPRGLRPLTWPKGVVTVYTFQRLSEAAVEDLLLEYYLDASGTFQDKRTRLFCHLGMLDGPTRPPVTPQQSRPGDRY